MSRPSIPYIGEKHCQRSSARQKRVKSEAEPWGWSPIPLLLVLYLHGVRFVAIGSLAEFVHDVQIGPPGDLDIAVGSGATNARRVELAISSATRFLGGVDGPETFSAEQVAAGACVRVTTQRGALHVVGHNDLPVTSDSLVARRRWAFVKRMPIPIARLDDLRDLRKLKMRDRRDQERLELLEEAVLRSKTCHPSSTML